MLRLLAGALALALTAPVWADQPSFSFAGAAGYHVLIFDNTSFFTNGTLVRAEVDVGLPGSVDDEGYGVSIGVRSNTSQRIEAERSLSYVDLGNSADGLAVGGAGWYRLSDSFAIGLIVNFDEDVVAYGIGGRYYFGD